MKRILVIFLILISGFNLSVALAQDNNKEYGILLLLPEEYFSEAQKMNEEIAAQSRIVENLPNIFHITLFQGRFGENKIEDLYQELKNQNFRKVKIITKSKITTTDGRYINWVVKKNDEIKDLHRQVLEIANPYHQGTLVLYIDSYASLNQKQQKQVESYGMAGVLDEYNPHVTLFYFTQKNSDIDIIAGKISPPRFMWKNFTATQMAIAELGYDGNIKQILYKIDLQ
jgi:2'-5' RNA ligase